MVSRTPARGTTEVTLANNLDASATDAYSSLVSAGASGIVSVSGLARDGSVGGTHTISIVGAQAQNALYTGANIGDDGSGAAVGSLSTSMVLGSLGYR